jgi:uncharacterized protein YcaQ
VIEQLSLVEARHVALAAQGFSQSRPARAGAPQLRRTLERLGLFQIDSVNVLARAHYLPAFSRLGAYDRALLDRACWGPRASRRCFEYWAHEASLLPLHMHPLLRWRMAEADRGAAGWTQLRVFASERRAEAMDVLARIRAEGPLAASDLGRGRPGWWAWSEPKAILEFLFWAGHVTTATRRGNFERVYDLTERVLPADSLALPTPPAAEAYRALMEIASRALGVATAAELRDYFRLRPAQAAPALEALRDAGVLLPVKVPGWPPAYRHRDARTPKRMAAGALIGPFDPLVWQRGRAERLFGFAYRIEIYTQAAKRQHGYYVLPFLFGDRLAARVDLKADRQTRTLVVCATHLEPHAPADTTDALGAELALLARWLELDQIVRRRGARVGGGLAAQPV